MGRCRTLFSVLCIDHGCRHRVVTFSEFDQNARLTMDIGTVPQSGSPLIPCGFHRCYATLQCARGAQYGTPEVKPLSWDDIKLGGFHCHFFAVCIQHILLMRVETGIQKSVGRCREYNSRSCSSGFAAGGHQKGVVCVIAREMVVHECQFHRAIQHSDSICNDQNGKLTAHSLIAFRIALNTVV